MPTDYNTKREQPKKDNKNRYVNQPQHHGWEELTPQMKNFWSDFSNLAYQKTGRYPKFTSGKRTSEQKVGKSHKTSKHNEGNAIDMSADFAMYNVLYNTPDGLTLLNSYNLGVLDETNPETMAKTGATGPHYHIGTDPGLVAKTKQRYSSYTENGNIDIVGLERDLTQAEFKIYAPAAQQLEEDIAVEIKKEEKKEEKEEKSESRKKVSPNKEKSFFSDIKIEQEKQQDFEPFQDTPETKVPDILSDYSSISSYVQTGLPKIPSLFKEITTEDLDKMEDGGIFGKKYGDVNYTERSDEMLGENWKPGLGRDRKEARQLKRKVNSKIRSGYVDSYGTDFSQFARTKTKDFIVEADPVSSFKYGGLLEAQEGMEMEQSQEQQAGTIQKFQNTSFKDGGEVIYSYIFDNIKKNIKLDLKNRSNFFAQNEIKLNNEQYK